MADPVTLGLGAAALIGQGLGAVGNFFIGRQQKKEGRRLARQGRKDMLATAGPTAELLAGVDETKGLIERGRARSEERLDSSVSGFLDALSSGDQSQISAMVPGFGQDVAQASSDLGLQTAASMAQANQPAIDAAERAMDVSRSLAGMDLQQGTEAFNKGRQLQFDAIGQVLNTPMDLAALNVANPAAFDNLFPFLGENGIKVGQEGSYTGGGINVQTIRDLLAALPKKKDKKEEDKKIRFGEATDTVDKVDNVGAMGGTMKPGDTFRTKGPEDHDKQEYNIVDAETGQTVAKTTGQEDHTVNEDGSMTVLNSEQSGSIHDAFKDVDVPMLLKFLEKYPQKGQVRDLMSALNVFTLPQFQD